jgi:(p)ppGpp synthase/HD superfamily hydrolase
MTDLVTRAKNYATIAHAYAVRKFGPPEPYIEHVKRVAALVAATGARPEVVAAAYLHDVVEDTEVTAADVTREFGPEVAELVVALTNVPTVPGGPNRAARHKMDIARLAKASGDAHTIKCADLIDNTSTINAHAPADFAALYLKEKAELLKVLTRGDPGLRAAALKNVSSTFLENSST